MLRKAVPVAAAAAVFSCGAAFAFTFAPVAAVQSMVIHASGTVSPPPSTPPASSPPPASSTAPHPLALPAVVPAPVSNSAAGTAPSKAAPATGGGIAPLRGQGGHSGGHTPVAEIPGRKVTVALLNGGQIAATRMRLGLHDALTVKNGKTVVAVALAQIAGMEFGEKELGRLAVTVNMVDGSVLVGNVYPGTVFEFEGKGRVTATRAEEIATISFPAE